jgi:hypothetical protein
LPAGLSFPARINVSFAITGPVLGHVAKLNRLLVDHGHTTIAFDGPAAVIPHLTLLMGAVGSEDAFESLCARIEAFCSGRPPIRYRVGLPYRSAPSGRFLFVDVVPQEPFRKLRVELFRELAPLLSCGRHGGPLTTSHVTIGYATAGRPSATLLQGVPSPRSSTAATIQVCQVGKRGTCIRRLRTARLQ